MEQARNNEEQVSDDLPVFTLSRKAKEAIKVALAMTITYAIALSMDWEKAYWAGFAVAFVSLASIGQSMNRAAMRMVATLVGVVVSLTIIGLFAQDRWGFILILSIYAGFCAYMMSGSKRAYFWQVSGFVVVVISISAGPNPVNAFDTAILRAQQTGLGILVYSLVSILLWPSRSIGAFNAAATDLAGSQHGFYQAGLGLARGGGDEQEFNRLGALQVQAKTRFDQLLDAAQTDSEEVSELRQAWRRYQRLAAELTHFIDLMRESPADMPVSELDRFLPGLEAFQDELDGRLAQIARIMGGDPPGQLPRDVNLSFDRDALRHLPHFQKAAIVVIRSHWLQLEQLTRSLFEVVSELRGFGTTGARSDPPVAAAPVFLPDLDRLANVIRYMAIMWMTWLAVIYVNDLPAGFGLFSFACALGIVIANTPQLPVSKLFAPSTTSVLFAAFAYILIMPTLSTFLGLGLLIFAATFTICYLFAEPQQMLGRALGLAMFFTIAAISNEQSYNFLSVANTAMMFPLIFLVFAITAYIPWSPRPERRIARLLVRFNRSSEHMILAMRWGPPHAETRLERWKMAFHAREVATLPAKLGTWAPQLDDWVLSSTTREQVQALVTSLQVLSDRMHWLLGERDTPLAPFLVQQLLADHRAWRISMQASLQQLAEGPTAGECDSLRHSLDERLDKLEERLTGILDGVNESRYSEHDAENFYRLLGAYRGVSEALVNYVGNAAAIDWAPWREERFA